MERELYVKMSAAEYERFKDSGPLELLPPETLAAALALSIEKHGGNKISGYNAFGTSQAARYQYQAGKFSIELVISH